MSATVLQCGINLTMNPRARRILRLRCSTGEPEKKAPPFLKVAVSGVTELLRILSSSSNKERLDTVRYKQGSTDIKVSSVDDIVMVLKSDYENAYFVTGIFTSEVYDKDCVFEDPTISFRGTELYARNLKLLVPFFDHPSIGLQNIDQGVDSETKFVLATWKLRTYLKLPWRPLISVNGTTVYKLNQNFKIIRHTESWDVSAVEAVAQIFTPSSRRPSN